MDLDARRNGVIGGASCAPYMIRLSLRLNSPETCPARSSRRANGSIRLKRVEAVLARGEYEGEAAEAVAQIWRDNAGL